MHGISYWITECSTQTIVQLPIQKKAVMSQHPKAARSLKWRVGNWALLEVKPLVTWQVSGAGLVFELNVAVLPTRRVRTPEISCTVVRE